MHLSIKKTALSKTTLDIIRFVCLMGLFTINFSMAQTPPPPYAPTNGLEGYWRLNNNYENHPKGVDFIEINSPSTVSFGADKDGNPDEALTEAANVLFTGIREDIDPSENSNFLITGNKISMQAKVKIDNSVATSSNQRSYIMGRNNNVAPFHSYSLMVEYNTTPARITFAISTDGTGNDLNLSFSLAPQDFNNWISLAAVYDGSEMRLYKNGVLMNSRVATGNILSGNTNRAFNIGGSVVNGLKFKGQIDEVYLFSRALSDSDIQQLNRVNSFIHYDLGPLTVSNLSQSGNVCFGTNKELELEVNRTNLSAISFQWKKGGTSLSNGTKYQGVNSSVLEIGDFQSSDEGTYTCEVTEGTETVTSDPIILGGVDGSIVDVNLAHHYPFYNGSVEDVIGTNNINSILRMAPTENRFGLPNSAYTHNGSGTAGTQMNLTTPITNNVTSVSFWMNYKQTSGINRGPLRGAASRNIIWITSSGEIRLLNSADGHNNTGVNLTNGWVHIAYAVNNNNSELFINGEKVYTMSNARLFSQTNLTAICQTQSAVTEDVYDDFRIYNEFLSEDKVKLIYNLAEFKNLPSEELTVCEGDDASINVLASDNVNNFQWFKGVTALTDGSEYTGTGTPTLVISDVSASNQGEYSVEVSNGCSAIKSPEINVTTTTGVGSDPTDGLVSYFPLDNYDRGLNLAGTDGITFTSGITPFEDRLLNTDRALNLGANNQRITLNNPITSNQTSVSFWAYNLAGTNFKVLLGSNDNNVNHFTLNNGNMIFYPSTTENYISTGVVLPSNEWLHITLVRDGSNAKYYVNGNLIIDVSDARLFSVNPLQVFGNNTNQAFGFAGRLDEIRIYDRVLSDDEVLNLYNLVELQHDSFESNKFACEGGQIEIAYTAAKTPSSYQWLKNGNPVSNSANVSGVNSPILSISNLSANELGDYQLQTFNGCAENRSPVTAVSIGSVDLNITSQPAASLITCDGETVELVVSISGTPTSLQWYKDGAPLTDGGDISGANTTTLNLANATSDDNGSYYLEIEGGSCGTLTTAEAFVIVNSAPSIPEIDPFLTPASSLTICEGTSATITLENPSDGSVAHWFTSATSTNSIATGNVFETDNLSSNTTFYVERRSGNCESTRIAIDVQVNDVPSAPTTTNQFFCGTATVADLVATGDNIKWYNDATGGVNLGAGVTLATGNYYASQTNNGCESLNRALATVTVTPIPAAPTGDAVQTFCSHENPLLSDLEVTGTTILWYNAATNGQIFEGTNALISGTYYASQTVNGCESTDRLAVTTSVNTSPGVPTGDATQFFCAADNATVNDVDVTGLSVTWFDAASGGSVVVETTSLTDGLVIYAESNQNNCPSANRLEVMVTVTDPVAPIAENQVFCGDGTIADLVVTGTAIKWYNSETSTTVLDETTDLMDATTYFASQTINGCESEERVSVEVTINSIPSTPTGNDTQNFCSVDNPTIADLAVNEPTVIWYEVLGGGEAIETTATLTDGIYYAAQIIDGCESLDRLAVNVSVTAIDNGVLVNENVITANNANAAYQWIDCDDNNAPIAGATNQSFTATESGNYAVTISLNDCEETSDCILVEVDEVSVEEAKIESLQLFPNPSNGLVTISATQTLAQVNIMNSVGQIIETLKTSEEHIQFNVSDWSKGVYWVNVVDASGAQEMMKLVVQ